MGTGNAESIGDNQPMQRTRYDELTFANGVDDAAPIPQRINYVFPVEQIAVVKIWDNPNLSRLRLPLEALRE